MKYIKGKGFFCKMVRGGRVLYRIEKSGGVLAKVPPLLPPRRRTEEGAVRAGGRGQRALGLGGGCGEGEEVRETMGCLLPTSIWAGVR